MQTLTAIIMRHAQAAEQRPTEPDFERPLVASGCEDAQSIGGWLRRSYPRPAKVLSSPALRARMTAEAVLGAWATAAPPIEWLPELYLAELPTLLDTLATVGTTPVLLIGHNPGLEDLVAYLLPRGDGSATRDTRMPTAGVSVIEVGVDGDGVRRGGGILRARSSPAELARAADPS